MNLFGTDYMGRGLRQNVATTIATSKGIDPNVGSKEAKKKKVGNVFKEIGKTLQDVAKDTTISKGESGKLTWKIGKGNTGSSSSTVVVKPIGPEGGPNIKTIAILSAVGLGAFMLLKANK